MRSQSSWFFLFLIFPFFINSQSHNHKTRINLTGKTIQDLQKTGLAFDHGTYIPGVSFTGIFSHEELETLSSHGFQTEIILDKILSPRQSPVSCDPKISNTPNYPLPLNYPYGSMGGFPTLQEMNENLDLMHELYPKLISERKPIGNFRTFNNHTIDVIKISDNPNVLEEDEPEILYTGLHHAREPLSMSQLLYFMWYLLENYEYNPEIRTLVDSRALYFVPCINPDGYEYNEQTNPDGEGYWRKNRNPNFDGIGSDLNRNYGYQWGFNNNGSSNNGTSDVFRGESSFSEVETKAIKYLCEQHEFKIALNYHTFGNLLIIPWGYSNVSTQDSSQFNALAQLFTQHNHFTVGTSFNTLNYEVNGVSDDWMYGDTKTKNKIFAFTPEVGPSFWPNRVDILPLNKSTQFMNVMAAWNAGAYADLEDFSPTNLNTDAGTLNLLVKRSGIENANINILCTSNFSGLVFDTNPIDIYVDAGSSKMTDINYHFNSTPNIGDSIELSFKITTGNFIKTLVVKKLYVGKPIWSESCENINQWYAPSNNPFVLSNKNFTSSPSSYTDSPGSNLIPNRKYKLKTVFPIDLTHAKNAYLSFNAAWDLDVEGDFAQIQVSADGDNFDPVCGKFSVAGGAFQDLNNPVYTGLQKQWVSEWINLDKYKGKSIYLQIIMNTNQSEFPHDGFYIDDIKVFSTSLTNTLDLNTEIISLYPQPTRHELTIHTRGSIDCSQLNLETIDGKNVKSSCQGSSNEYRIDVSNLNSGVYLLKYNTKSGHREVHKVIIQ